MFSGLTNQISSFSSKFTKSHDEEVPTPPQSAVPLADGDVAQNSAPEPAVAAITAENNTADNTEQKHR